MTGPARPPRSDVGRPPIKPCGGIQEAAHLADDREPTRRRRLAVLTEAVAVQPRPRRPAAAGCRPAWRAAVSTARTASAARAVHQRCPARRPAPIRDRDRRVRRSSVPGTGSRGGIAPVATVTARSKGRRLPSCPGPSWRSPSHGAIGVRGQLRNLGRKAGTDPVARDVRARVAVVGAWRRYGHRDPCAPAALSKEPASRCEAHITSRYTQTL